jgi:glyoxylase-like metal-dependent hydrolase (beta-lactamase superfamily II)
VIFFLGETPDGWGIPGIHGMLAEDELDGYVQGAVYLIRGRNENLLIDSGNWTLPEFNNGMGEFLVNLLDKERNKLKYIFLTHFHYDHVGNAALLKERYGAQVLCHPTDRPIIEDPLIVTRPENVTRFGLTPEQLLEDFNLAAGESLGLSDPEIIRKYWSFPVKVDRTVEDGDILEVGGLNLKVVHLPGHAPGQIGLWNQNTRTLYAADLLHYPTPLGPYPIEMRGRIPGRFSGASISRLKFYWKGMAFRPIRRRVRAGDCSTCRYSSARHASEFYCCSAGGAGRRRLLSFCPRFCQLRQISITRFRPGLVRVARTPRLASSATSSG